jgi:hypothetical protein
VAYQQLEGYHDNDLFEQFQEQFKNFETATFNQLSYNNLILVRISLRRGGVFVKSRKGNLTSAEAISEVLERTELYIWTLKDWKECEIDLIDNYEITSTAIDLTRLKTRASINSP